MRAFAFQEPDRVPIGYSANPGIDGRLKEHYGLAEDSGTKLMDILGVDFRGAYGTYVGERLHEDIPERGVVVDDWGIHRRYIEHDTGGYWDFCDFPLQEATEEEVSEQPAAASASSKKGRMVVRFEPIREYNGRPGIRWGGSRKGSMAYKSLETVDDDAADDLLN